MRLLIIGASGFLGGHVCRQAAAAGLTVAAAGRSVGPRSLSDHRLDLSRDAPAAIAAVIASASPDVIVNCAGATAGDPDVLAEANITATSALVTAMVQARMPARLVHLGSAAEYGRTEPDVPVAESAPVRPAGAYGLTKLAGTRLVELARTAGLDAVVLRVFNAVGAGAPDNGLAGRAAMLLRQAQASGTDVQLGSLDPVRDFIDARDVADAVLAAAAAPRLPHPVINIGSGAGVPARALVKELLAVSGCSAAVHEDAPGSARSGSLPGQQADITRARRDLGWQPSRNLTAAVSDLWEASRDPARR
jgi:nucleoside-diphosphate-sugar epimerase